MKMDNQTYIHMLNVGSVILVCMSAICLIGTAIAIYRWRREARRQSDVRAAEAMH